MKKPKNIRPLFLIPLASIFIFCKDGKTTTKDALEPSMHDTVAIVSTKKTDHQTDHGTANIQRLKEAFENKNEGLFLEQFPSDFQQFMQYFGWSTETDQPSELYEESYAYIDYFFNLLSHEKYRKFESKLVGIAKNGFWQEDGVSYFQHHVLEYIKENEKYYLINELDDKAAKSVLFFLFDGPHPKLDTDFAYHLNPVNKEILEQLFETGFYDLNENPDPIVPDPVHLDPMDYEGSIAYEITDFEGTEHFFIRDIDINNDGILDKIVSGSRYQGDELYLFVKKGNEYQFALKTTNFSDDGGNQIDDVVAESTGFFIKTTFPNSGLSEAYHHIAFIEGRWVLTNSVYRAQSSNQEDAFIYVCDVQQGLDLSDANALYNLKWMPDESDRDRLCTKEMD